ncbi:pseudouridine synthase [Falsiporphyromonas endometrii]|uniref:Pseudouridine synthase n=1 Tax=Falsiporphyromonas endometrii TaxID=1387297 RepID=A0ABV9K5Q4_9PORP
MPESFTEPSREGNVPTDYDSDRPVVRQYPRTSSNPPVQNMDDRYGRNNYQPRNNYQRGGYQQGGYQRNNNYRQNNYQPGYQDRNQDNRPVYPHKPMPQGDRRDGGYYQRPYGQGDNRGRYDNRRRNNNRPQRPQKKIIPVKYEEMVTDPNEEIRLNKILANAGICSRREADQLIQQGLVTVNGEVVTELGTRATRQDEILFQGRPVRSESKVYVLLNKPRNCVTTSDDPQCRLTVMDLVKRACSERIYPVGRLDRNTTGVILITNDGDLAAKLTHPQYKKKKIYHVWLDKDVKIEDMQKIAEGIELEDGEIHADAISYVKDDDPSQVGIEIHSGRNRIVRRIFEHLGYRVVKLDRVYFAGLTKKNLPRGKWRYLNEQEVNNLRMGCFD